MIKNISALILSIFVLSACMLYRIDSEEVTTNFYPSKSAGSEVEYAETVSRAHEVIGFVTVNAERNQKMPDVLARMKREAGVMGGDAITNITTNASGTWKKLPPQKLLKNAYIRANFTATVIKYKDNLESAPAETK
jgi:hypothetical protein